MNRRRGHRENGMPVYEFRCQCEECGVCFWDEDEDLRICQDCREELRQKELEAEDE